MPLEMILICYDDEGHEHRFPCANGFVSRVVSAVFHSDNMGCYSDARRVMEIMNANAAEQVPAFPDVPELAADRIAFSRDRARDYRKHGVV